MSYRAKFNIPCTFGRCPGRMHLQVNLNTGERPYYECDQDGKEGSRWECPNSFKRSATEREEWAAQGNHIFPEHIRTKYVMDGERMKPGLKTEERLMPGELEAAL